jgi:hypothetical protein
MERKKRASAKLVQVCKAIGIPVEESDSDKQLQLLIEEARSDKNLKIYFDENGNIKDQYNA